MLSEWWKEFAECSVGPGALVPASSSKGSASEVDEAAQFYTIEEERVGVPVKGGLYEVNLGFHLFSFFCLYCSSNLFTIGTFYYLLSQ